MNGHHTIWRELPCLQSYLFVFIHFMNLYGSVVCNIIEAADSHHKVLRKSLFCIEEALLPYFIITLQRLGMENIATIFLSPLCTFTFFKQSNIIQVIAMLLEVPVVQNNCHKCCVQYRIWVLDNTGKCNLVGWSMFEMRTGHVKIFWVCLLIT